MENQQASQSSILQCPDPAEHALVLIEVEQGDLVAAWTLALNNRCHAPSREEQAYWFEVAEAIARHRPAYTDPQFYRRAN